MIRLPWRKPAPKPFDIKSAADTDLTLERNRLQQARAALINDICDIDETIHRIEAELKTRFRRLRHVNVLPEYGNKKVKTENETR